MIESDGKQSSTHPGGATMSLWQGTLETPQFDEFSSHAKADVCVIGAGIAGLSVAYHLAREGKRVVVLDDGPIGGGETGRTTAHLTDAIDDRIYWLESVLGAKNARLVVESHAAAINRVQQIVQLEHIDCDFERLDGYLMSREPAKPEELEREAQAAERIGLSDVVLVQRAPIASFESGTALRFPGQGKFHVLKYIAGLANAIVEKYGGAIYCDTHVEGLEGGDPCTVKIAGGKELKAGSVVVCTNSSITDYVRTHVMSEPMRSYVIAAVVPRGSVENALYWDTGKAYHYVRTQKLEEPTADSRQPRAHSKGEVLYDALIVGGEDDKVGHHSKAEDRWGSLERWMRERWPQAQEVIYRWSGQVNEPADGVAFIGRTPDGSENVFMASGDSGQGMTHGTIAGILIADLIAGRDNPWAELYDPKRVTLRPSVIGEVAKHNVDVAVQYAKGFIMADGTDVDAIPPGEGRVIARGLKRVAAYRDPQGQLYEKSAVCTHLKCTVQWNNTEKSWDCPCHGSRFSPTGEVLNGPAAMPLEDVEPERSRKASPKRSRRAPA